MSAPTGSKGGETAAPQKPKLNFDKYRIRAAPPIDKSHIEKLSNDEARDKLNLRKIEEIEYNPEYSVLLRAQEYERQDLATQGKLIKKNTLTGYVETTNLGETQFEEQRRKYHSDKAVTVNKYMKAIEQRSHDETCQNETEKQPHESQEPKVKKRIRNDDPTDIDGYAGPWAAFEGERHVSRPNEEDAATLAEYLGKRKKRSQPNEEQPKGQAPQDKSTLHIKDPYDYQGRSFLVAPRDLDGVNLYSDTTPDGCRIPRNLGHTFKGHTKPITASRFFPNTAHLILSSSLDGKVKIWEMYKERRCIMTYQGHKQGVRDIGFNNTGDKFVSASYDQTLKLWDTETGQCTQRFAYNKIAYCVKFNPDPECSHLFLSGMSNKKILCWDCRTGDVVQEYDRHLGAVNTINFVDENRKFISTSDDKSLRVWEWDIPVDVKYIADPTLHSLPAVTSSPNNKKLLCQSMDNKIQVFTCGNKFKLDNKKVFKGHMVAGYACVPDFSCDMSLVVSGDADGKIFFWNWSSAKIVASFKAHDNTCISVNWHPHEKQKLVSAGWDNLLKIWE